MPELSTRLRQRLGLAQPAAVMVERTEPLDFDGYTELRVARGHALDHQRFEAIVQWIVGRVHMDPSPQGG